MENNTINNQNTDATFIAPERVRLSKDKQYLLIYLPDNKIIRKITVETGKTKEIIIGNLLRTIETLFDKKIKAIGIGCPGPSDYQKGIVGDTPNLPLKGINLKKIISNKFKKSCLRVKI